MEDVIKFAVTDNTIYRSGINKINSGDSNWKFLADFALLKYKQGDTSRANVVIDMFSFANELKNAFQYLVSQGCQS